MGNKPSYPTDSVAGMATSPTLTQPFPISNTMTTELNKISNIMDRLLTTGDVLDLSGMMQERPGDSCGGYVFFLADEIQKSLMAVSIKDKHTPVGGPKKIVYQSTTQSVADADLRKQICTDVTELSLRTLLTVVALFASIQVSTGDAIQMDKTAGLGTGRAFGGARKTRGRQAGARRTRTRTRGGGGGGGGQRGGVGIVEDEAKDEEDNEEKAPVIVDVETFKKVEFNKIHAFLFEHSYVDFKDQSPLRTLSNKNPTTYTSTHTLVKPSGPGASRAPFAPFTFTITYISRDQNVVTANIDISITKKKDNKLPIPSFPLVLEMMEPINLSSQGMDRYRQGQGAKYDVVPIRIMIGNKVLGAGILTNDFYLNFTRISSQDTRVSLYGMLFKAFHLASQRVPLVDQKMEGVQFERLLRTKHVVDQLGILIDTFGSSGLQKYGLMPPSRGVVVEQQPFMYDKRKMDYGNKSLSTSTGFAARVVAGLSPKFGEKMSIVRKLYPIRSSPAKVRAESLAGTWDSSTRTQTTKVCSDSYWNKNKSLESIFPWATLQYLYVKEMKTIGTNALNSFDTEAWTADFVHPLQAIYPPDQETSLLPSLLGKGTLAHLSFTQTEPIPLCKNTLKPEVRTDIILHGTSAIYALYKAHTTAVIAILNNLVQVLEDPTTHRETVRLHTNVTQGKDGDSVAYVNEQSILARKAIAAFYVEVEAEYAKAVVHMTDIPQNE